MQARRPGGRERDDPGRAAAYRLTNAETFEFSRLPKGEERRRLRPKGSILFSALSLKRRETWC
jgi:hypothetical protein